MKKAIVIALLLAATAASASCPQFQPYRCVPGYQGKMLCGCGL